MEITAENIPVFKELRLKIRDNRTKGIEKWHKAEKEYFLRGGQFVDAVKRKEVLENERMEENLESNEKHFERLEQERINRLAAERKLECDKFNADTSTIDLGNMGQDLFEALLIKYERDFKEAERLRIEAEKAEEERLAKIKIGEERTSQLLPVWTFLSAEESASFASLSEKDFKTLLKSAQSKKVAHDTEQEKIKTENARLQKLADEAKAAVEKRNKRITSLSPYIRFIRDYDKTINLPDKEFDSELKLLSRAAIQEANAQYEKEKAEAEEIKKKEALAKKSLSHQCAVWIKTFELPETSLKGEVVNDIIAKFNSFKNWALKECNKIAE